MAYSRPPSCSTIFVYKKVDNTLSWSIKPLIVERNVLPTSTSSQRTLGFMEASSTLSTRKAIRLLVDILPTNARDENAFGTELLVAEKEALSHYALSK